MKKKGAGGAPIGVVINGHREGQLLAHTLESLALARDYAAERGVAVDVHLTLDRADDATIAVADRYASMLASCEQVSFGNLGASREAGLARAHNEWVAFLDGDDLISRNWLNDAFAYAQTVGRPRDTIFHTELFIGFGAEVFFRRALRTSDPEFDPLCLIADWFFCNNLFAHRSVFERCPVEPYDHEKGLGAEDWHWSCQTTAAGFARDFVPRTTYFYRMKPAAESLGQTGGLLHKASRLFEREALAGPARSPQVRGAAELFDPAADTPRLRREVPGWVSEQALDQGRVESQTIEIVRFIKTNPAASRTFPPRMHHGVADVYRRSAARLTDAPKIALFWGDAAAIGGAHFLPRMIETLRETHPGHQIVLFSETDSTAADGVDAAFPDDQVVVIDYAAARRRYRIPEHYLAALTARYFLQFDFELIVNVGGQAFDEVISMYERVIAHRCNRLVELAPYITFDRANHCMDRLIAALPNRALFDARMICLSEMTASLLSAALLHSDVTYDANLRAAIKDALRVRWSGDLERMAKAHDAVDFSVLLSDCAPRQARVPRKLGDYAIVMLANGPCPELGAVYAGAATKANAALHIYTTAAHKAALERRTRFLSGATVQVLPEWTSAACLEALKGIDAALIAVLEPGAIIGSEFIQLGAATLRDRSAAAAVPEAVVRRNGRLWEMQQRFRADRLSPTHKDCIRIGGLEPVGAVLFVAWGESAPRVSKTPSASVLPNVIAAAAAQRSALCVAEKSMVLNLAGSPWAAVEWARFLKAPTPVDVWGGA